MNVNTCTFPGVERKNELPTIIFSKDMLDINSKRIHIEQTLVNEKDYTEDGESSEDENSIRSENGNIDVFGIESNKLFSLLLL